MSNLEEHAAELPLNGPPESGVEILEPREVPLGGPRAMLVHRTLPQRRRSLIGAWCFVDHYGPEDVSRTGGMVVPPHPHIGLQTVSWLFEGEVEHRDSVGSRAVIAPGTLNLMTAGRGIQHSEYSTEATSTLHGAQLWLALPAAERGREASFESTDAVRFSIGGARVSLFIGELAARSAASTVHSRLLGAEVLLPANETTVIPVDPGFELGVLVDRGEVAVDGVDAPVRSLAFRPPGSDELRLSAGSDGARVLLLGGEPLGEQLVMWWNFVGRDHEEIVRAREDWEASRIAESSRYGSIDDPRPALPAPVLPPVRLQSRG